MQTGFRTVFMPSLSKNARSATPSRHSEPPYCLRTAKDKVHFGENTTPPNEKPPYSAIDLLERCARANPANIDLFSFHIKQLSQKLLAALKEAEPKKGITVKDCNHHHEYIPITFEGSPLKFTISRPIERGADNRLLYHYTIFAGDMKHIFTVSHNADGKVKKVSYQAFGNIKSLRDIVDITEDSRQPDQAFVDIEINQASNRALLNVFQELEQVCIERNIFQRLPKQED